MITTIPPTAALLRVSLRHASPHNERSLRMPNSMPSVVRAGAGAVTAIRVPPLLSNTDARIEQAIDQIDSQVANRDQEGVEQRIAHDHRIVTSTDRLDKLAAHARNIENGLDEERAGEQACDRRSHNRRDRDQRVFEHMP